jgi:hypothetical protein
MKCQPDLLEVVDALRARGGIPHFLDRWHQEGHQDGDNRNDDQKLHQRKPPLMLSIRTCHGPYLTQEDRWDVRPPAGTPVND